MPSYNRLLILAVLALSVSVQSGPSGDVIPTGLSVVNGATEAFAEPAPIDNFEDEVGEDLDEDEDDAINARQRRASRSGPPHNVNTASPHVGKPCISKPHNLKASRSRALHGGKPSNLEPPSNVNTVSPTPANLSSPRRAGARPPRSSQRIESSMPGSHGYRADG